MKLSYYFLFICLFVISSCASYDTLEEPSEPEEPEEEEELSIPAGVDTLTAKEAQELADDSFVSYQKEQEAEKKRRQAEAYRAESDTLWYLLTLDEEDQDEYEVEEEQDVEAIEAFNEGAEHYSELNDLEQEDQDMGDAEMERRHEELLNKSIDSFEEALELNPFDNQTRLILGQLYGVKASRLTDRDEHKRAIEVLEKLVRVEKGEHFVYASLAENYFSVDNYELAAKNFDQAGDILYDTARLTDFYDEHGAISPQDSSTYFLYSYYKGQSYTEIFDAEQALEAFNKAKTYASAENDLQAVESEIDFIEWDDGNILGSMRRDSLVTLANNNQFAEAEEGYFELKENLKTSYARDEIDWRLGVVQYQLGQEEDKFSKLEEAAERLNNLYHRTEKDDEGNPVDSDYERYINDFGIITYNIGLEFQNEGDRSTALKYFNQSSKANWDERARSKLRIADLLSNNVSEAIRYAEKAVTEVESLSEEDQRALYELLTDLHRRDGNMEAARKYRDLWSEI